MREPAKRRSSAELAKFVVKALRREQRPMSAYEIISALRGQMELAPPTVYRVLEKLIEAGLVHKLESLNAFVACSHEAHGDDAAFAICDDCGSVTEFSAPSINKSLLAWSRSHQFALNATVVELHGKCATCRGGADEPAHA